MFSLSFLNAGLLIFSAATILPLIIWLLAKRKPKQVVFSTLRFIRLSKEQQKNRTKLNNIILLIIRMLIILFVMLSAARPLLQSRFFKPSTKHPPTAVAILLETSYNMDYLEESKTRMDLAKAALLEINKRSTKSDRLVLITSDEIWNNLHAQLYAGEIPSDLIEQIEITHKPLSRDQMLELALQKLSDSQLSNREIYLISDMGKRELSLQSPYVINVIPLVENEDFENISCRNAEPLPQLVERSRTQSIRFELQNHGSRPRQDVLVKAVLNDVKVAEKFVNIPAGQSVSEVISFEIRKDGWQQGFIEVLDERLMHDNRSYFAFSYYLSPTIGVISERSSLPLPLASMLNVYAGSAGKVQILPPATLNLQNLGSYNLLVLYEPGAYGHRMQELLAALKAKGSGVLYVMGSELSADWKEHLRQVFGVSVKAKIPDPVSISYVNKYHYSTSLLQEDKLRKVQMRDYWQAENTGAANLLIASDRLALSVAAEGSILWLWDSSSSRNPFISDPAYAVFAYRSFQHLGSAVKDSQIKSIGQSIKATAITYPDGKHFEQSYSTHILNQPGIYSIRNGDGMQDFVAVNMDYAFSNYQKADYAKDRSYRLLTKDWKEKLFFSRMGHDLWKFLLIAALLLMIIEIIIVKVQEAKPGQGVKE